VATRHRALSAAERGPVTWLEKHLPEALGTAITTFLGVLYAAVRILWDRLVTKQDKRVEELEAELKATTKELWKVHRELDWLRGKCGEKRANSSSPPPSFR